MFTGPGYVDRFKLAWVLLDCVQIFGGGCWFLWVWIFWFFFLFCVWVGCFFPPNAEISFTVVSFLSFIRKLSFVIFYTFFVVHL